jgi:hypothetical protein
MELELKLSTEEEEKKILQERLSELQVRGGREGRDGWEGRRGGGWWERRKG